MATREYPSDERALKVSVIVSSVFAVVSLIWGWATNSQLITFDGLYTSAAVFLSLLGVRTLHTVAKGADARYPWGREIFEPLTIIVKAAALGGLCVYADVTAISELLTGGREIAAGWALIYGVTSFLTCLAVTLYLRRVKGKSELVRAEAAEWSGDAMLTGATLIGFVIAVVLTATGHHGLAAYVDPIMVILSSTAFLVVPAGLIRSGLREVLTMAPSEAVRGQLQQIVDDVCAQYRFAESFLRASKTGSRLDIEIFFVTDDRSLAQDVRQLDAVRQALHERLEPLGLDRAVTVAFTADRSWAV